MGLELFYSVDVLGVKHLFMVELVFFKNILQFDLTYKLSQKKL